jgi:uncharacterized membrane protein
MPVWLIPMVYTVLSVIGAFVLPRLEHVFADSIDIGLSVASGVAALSAIASGMMALTGIVFSVAFVMLQFSAVTYSPRFASRFARDPVLFHALGMFFATFTYSLAVVAWADRDGSGRVPALSWFLAVALLFASMIAFVLLLRRLGDLQIGGTLRFLGDQGRHVIAQTFAQPLPTPLQRASAAGPAPALGVAQTIRHRGAPRYVERFDMAALVHLARQAEAQIEMECAVGDMLPDGAVMLRVLGDISPIAEQALRRAVRLGPDRTFEQDPKYPIRLLVDVAIKALSPAINDPTTAVQAIDQIEDLLRRLAQHDLDVGRIADAQGVLRLTFRTPSWDDYLSLSLDEIRMFGMSSIQVMRRLRSALMGLDEALQGNPRADPVRRYLRHIDSAIEASALDAQDRALARQEDPQGLGLTR